ncbi:MAG: hypothetical protein ACYC2H_05290 [Thermoplasmatota archaeon]
MAYDLAGTRAGPPGDMPSNMDLGQAWECADCGWTVEAARLQSGSSLEDARDKHSEKYCARPPTWPP